VELQLAAVAAAVKTTVAGRSSAEEAAARAQVPGPPTEELADLHRHPISAATASQEMAAAEASLAAVVVVEESVRE
jgi:hypothetical protein